jgi:menaquinol-cytochrome c reductase iron-sulfur subunit
MTHDHDLTDPIGQEPSPSRRRFLSGLNIFLSGVIAIAVGFPVVGFLFAPLVEKTPRLWRSVGPVNKFKVGETVEVSFFDASPLPWAGLTARTAAWLHRIDEQRFQAFSVNCTHLGCPVQWEPTATLFLCPCHGGVYYKNGVVAAGPPPNPLPQYPVRTRNGQVEILTSGTPITRSI